MTADIINLRQRRKAKTRAGKEQLAAENRAKFGRTKDQRGRDAADKRQAEQHLDGHELGGDAREPSPMPPIKKPD